MKIKPGKEVSIKRNIFFSLLFMVTLSIVLVGTTWYFIENKDLKNSIEELNNRELEIQKNYLRYEVNKILSEIQFRKNYYQGNDPEEIKEQILDWIAHLRLIYGGYVFVNKIDGQALVFDGQKVSGYKNISEMTDPNGLRLFDIEKQAYYDPDGKYMEYLFKPMDSEIPEEKLSYMIGYPEWEWIIGAGIYKEAPTQAIHTLELGYYNKFENELLLIAIISFILIVISYFIVKHIDSRLYTQIGILRGALQQVAKNDENIDLQGIQFSEFKKIAESINSMIEEKKILTNKIIEKDQNLKSIFQAAEDVAFVITELKGEQSIINEFSPGAEKLFGYKRTEILGEDAIKLHYKDDYTNFIKIQKLLSGGLKGFNGETRLISKSNKPITALFTMHPLIVNNKVTGTIAVIIDISKRKRAENELERLKISLEGMVQERTKEINKKNQELILKNKELEHYNNLFVGREFRINELKIRIKELEDAVSRKN